MTLGARRSRQGATERAYLTSLGPRRHRHRSARSASGAGGRCHSELLEEPRVLRHRLVRMEGEQMADTGALRLARRWGLPQRDRRTMLAFWCVSLPDRSDHHVVAVTVERALWAGAE